MKHQETPRDVVGVIADAFGVSKEYVRLIINGDRSTNTDKSKAIREAYTDYLKGKNKLIKEVKKLVKF